VINVFHSRRISKKSLELIKFGLGHYPGINHPALTMDAINPAESDCGLKQVVVGTSLKEGLKLQECLQCTCMRALGLLVTSSEH